MSSTLLERVRTWIAANDAASAARDTEIAEHGFEVNDWRWTDVLALMPPVREIAEGLMTSTAEVALLTTNLEEARLTQREEIKRLDAALTTARANLQHVEHALGDRLKPGKTLEWTIAEMFTDLDRADQEQGAVRKALGLPLDALPSTVIGQIRQFQNQQDSYCKAKAEKKV